MGLKSFLLGTAGALLLLAPAGVAQADTGFGTLASPPFGTEVRAVAIDQSNGSVYVVQTSFNRVEKFDASGNPILTFGKTGVGNGEFTNPEGIAVDQSTHDVYVVDIGSERVEKFDSSGNYLSQFGAVGQGAGYFNFPTGATVDAGGNVYIADSGNHRIQKFDSTGRFLLTFGWGVSDGHAQLETCVSTCREGLPGRGNGQFEKPVGVAVDSAGAVYVADSEARRVEKFDSSGNFLAMFDTGGSPQALAVDSSNDLYIGDNRGEPHVLEFDSSGTTIDSFGVGQIGEVAGIAVNSSLARVYVANSLNGVAPFSLTTLPHSTTGAASNETTESAEVSGTVNPERIEASYHFEYGLDTTYRTGCSSPPCISPQPDSSAGLGSSPVPVEPPVALTELEPSATYHYRLVATNISGSTYGADRTFKTLPVPPSVDGQSATPSATSATLNAQINPKNLDTHYHFEYGLAACGPTSCGTSIPLVAGDAGSGFGDQEVAATIASGLTPSTTYHYNVYATNGTGPEVQGTDQTFTTLPPAPIPLTGLASPIATTAATLNGTVNPEGSDTTYYFQYGTDTSYEINGAPGIVPASPTAIGSESIPLAATAEATGLQPNTTYHFRLVATNAGGEDTVFGADQSFTTVALAPAVTTGLVVEATATTATLGGGIVPQGVDTTYHFEWGTTTAYGSDVPAPDGDAGSAVNTQGVTAGIAGLAPNTTYHYRLVASSSGGTTFGWDQTLTTSPPVPAASTGPTSSGGQSAPLVPFPNLSGLTPMPPPPAKTTITPKALTNAQKLTKALKACKRDKSKSKRTACEKQAKKKYAAKRKPKKH